MSMIRPIDTKFHAEVRTNGPLEGIAIVKTSNGEEIPLGEPLFLFRGHDRLAVAALLHYRELCVADGCTEYQLNKLDGMIAKFKGFAINNPDEMKQPGITLGI